MILDILAWLILGLFALVFFALQYALLKKSLGLPAVVVVIIIIVGNAIGLGVGYVLNWAMTHVIENAILH
jgi:hypothetical protein